MNHPFKALIVALTCLNLAFVQLSFASSENLATEPSVSGEGVINLLEGETLDAWQTPSECWSLNQGSIVGDTGPEKITIPDWFYTKQRFSDFEFTCELRLTGDKRRNTGIYFRVNTFTFEKNPKKPSFEAPSGYEFDAAYHDPKRRNNRGSLGDWYARPSLRILPDPAIIQLAYKEEDWNRMTIRATGNRLEYWVNGFKVMDYIDTDPKGSRDGHIGIQIHDGSVMKIECQNIRVRPL